MPRYIAFLRAINAGPGRTVKMLTLRQAFESLGFSEVVTIMGTGNVVFEEGTEDSRILESKIGEKLGEVLGYAAPAFIRTPGALAGIAAYEAFPGSEDDPSAEHNIIFLADQPDETLIQRVDALQTDTDRFIVHEREIYWQRRKKPDGTYFSTVPLEKTIGMPFTVRGARTVKLIAAKYGENES